MREMPMTWLFVNESDIAKEEQLESNRYDIITNL